MAINIDLWRNSQGRLNGANPLGLGANWQLPAANYVSAKMPMNLVFPRPEAASWSYAKNAYTGVKWNIPIGIQGGAWPFHYQVLSDGGATGVTIGEFLTSSVDGATGKQLYTVGDDYGVLSWDNPQTGSYTITVRVTDQDANTLDVTVSLTVGTSGWVFVDPVNGNDSTGDGSIGNPFASLVPLHNGSNNTSTYTDFKVYLRGGATPLGYMHLTSGTYSILANGAPKQYIGYPNENVKLENTDAAIWTTSVDDFLMMDMEFAYADSYTPVNNGGIWQIVNDNKGDRHTLHNVHFSRFVGTPQNSGLGNPASYLSTAPSSNQTSEHLYMGRIRVTGAAGQVLCSFQNANSLCEHWVFRNATILMPNIIPFAAIFLKDDPDYFTIRNIDSDSTVDATAAHSLVGIAGQDGGTNLEFSYIKAYRPVGGERDGAIRLFDNNNTTVAIDKIYVYRNSMTDLKWEGDRYVGMPDEAIQLESNVSNSTLPTSTRIAPLDNVESGSFFDASMNLTGTSRTAYLGTHGAEVAQ